MYTGSIKNMCPNLQGKFDGQKKKNPCKHGYNFTSVQTKRVSWGSSISLVTRLWVLRLGFDSRQWEGFFLFATAYRPALWSTQPPIRWVPEAFSPAVRWLRREATPSHVHLVPRLRMRKRYRRDYPKVSGLAAWSENCKWYSSLPLGAVVSLFCESV
jgi:hypothetical protein